MNIKQIISSFFVLVTCALSSCTSSSSGNMLDAVRASRVRILESHEGPRLECRSVTSDDMNLLNISSLEEGSFIMVEAKDFCPGETYVLYNVNLKNEATSLATIIGSVDEISYSLLCKKNNFMKGETYTLVAHHLKSNQFKTLTIAANPIQVSWSDGASISCTALDETMNIWYLLGKGFRPNEMLQTTSKSWNEVMESMTPTSDAGWFVTLQIPGVIGKTGGINYITIKREDGEKRTIEIPYGSFAFH